MTTSTSSTAYYNRDWMNWSWVESMVGGVLHPIPIMDAYNEAADAERSEALNEFLSEFIVAS